MFGASASSSRAIAGTDSTSFNNVGLPGIGFVQDPIEYNSHTWHTNLDTFERIIEQDAKQSAITIASVLYHLAMRDEMLPRFPADRDAAAPAGAGELTGRVQEVLGSGVQDPSSRDRDSSGLLA